MSELDSDFDRFVITESCINELVKNVSDLEVEENAAEEHEALDTVISFDSYNDDEEGDNYVYLPAPPEKKQKLSYIDLEKVVDKASEDVIVPRTRKSYMS